MIGKTLAAYSDRRDTTIRLHMQLHRDRHPPSEGRQTFVAASYLPANCGTATLDVADVLCSGSLHSSPPGSDNASSGSKTVSGSTIHLFDTTVLQVYTTRDDGNYLQCKHFRGWPDNNRDPIKAKTIRTQNP